MDCLFCKMHAGEIPTKTVYENEFVKAIMDINPTSNGHVLIIPKKHVVDFMEMDNETLGHINDALKIIKEMVYKALNPDGTVLVVNYGLTQEVKHYHLHIIPAYKDHQDILPVDEIYDKIKKAQNWWYLNIDTSFYLLIKLNVLLFIASSYHIIMQ